MSEIIALVAAEGKQVILKKVGQYCPTFEELYPILRGYMGFALIVSHKSGWCVETIGENGFSEKEIWPEWAKHPPGYWGRMEQYNRGVVS